MKLAEKAQTNLTTQGRVRNDNRIDVIWAILQSSCYSCNLDVMTKYDTR